MHFTLFPHPPCRLVGVHRMHHADEDIGGQQGRTAAGEEGQGDAHHGEDGQAHAHVFQGLGDEDGGYAYCDEHTVIVAGLPSDPQHPQNQCYEGGDDHKAADKAEFFADRSQDEVGVGGGELLVVASAVPADAKEAAVFNALLGE